MSEFKIPEKLKKILDKPQVYDLFQTCTGYYKFMQNYVKTVLNKTDFSSVIDLGCGPGLLVKNGINFQNYIGIDFNSKYIMKFEKLAFNKNNVLLVNEVVQNVDLKKYEKIIGTKPVILALGLFHHMSIIEISKLFEKINALHNIEIQIISIDPVFTDNQSSISKFIVSNDRGKHVRHHEELKEILQSNNFMAQDQEISNKFTRIPSDLLKANWKSISI